MLAACKSGKTLHDCRFLGKEIISQHIKAWDGTATLLTRREESNTVCTHEQSAWRQYIVSPCGEVKSTFYCCREILISFDRSGNSLLNESSCAQIFGEEISKNSHDHITPVRIWLECSACRTLHSPQGWSTWFWSCRPSVGCSPAGHYLACSTGGADKRTHFRKPGMHKGWN